MPRTGTWPSQGRLGAGKDPLPHRRGGRKAGPSSRCSCPTPAQRLYGRRSRRYLKPGNALYFSHGFSIVYKDQTGVVPPKDIDVILVAPKGSGTNVRRHFLSRAAASTPASPSSRMPPAERESGAWPSGSPSAPGYLFPTTFQNEVFSDLTGERGVLMGALAGMCRRSTMCCASTATARRRRSTKPSRS